jgi:hypothetical protein
VKRSAERCESAHVAAALHSRGAARQMCAADEKLRVFIIYCKKNENIEQNAGWSSVGRCCRLGLD